MDASSSHQEFTDLPFIGSSETFDSGDGIEVTTEDVTAGQSDEELSSIVNTQMFFTSHAHSPGTAVTDWHPWSSSGIKSYCNESQPPSDHQTWTESSCKTEEWSPALSEALREQYANCDTKPKLRTPRTLTRLMQQHREKERHRHRGLNATIQEISSRIPGYQEACNETKIVKLQRIISYICHLERHIQALCEAQNIGLEFKNLFLSPHIAPQSEMKRGRLMGASGSGVHMAAAGSADPNLVEFYSQPAIHHDRERSLKISSPTIDSTTKFDETINEDAAACKNLNPLLDDFDVTLDTAHSPSRSSLLHDELRAKYEARVSSLQQLRSRGPRVNPRSGQGWVQPQLTGVEASQRPWDSPCSCGSGFSIAACKEGGCANNALVIEPVQQPPWDQNENQNVSFNQECEWTSGDLPLSPGTEALLHDSLPLDVTSLTDPVTRHHDNTSDPQFSSLRSNAKRARLDIKQETNPEGPGFTSDLQTSLLLKAVLGSKGTNRIHIYRVKSAALDRDVQAPGIPLQLPSGERIVIIKQEAPAHTTTTVSLPLKQEANSEEHIVPVSRADEVPAHSPQSSTAHAPPLGLCDTVTCDTVTCDMDKVAMEVSVTTTTDDDDDHVTAASNVASERDDNSYGCETKSLEGGNEHVVPTSPAISDTTSQKQSLGCGDRRRVDHRKTSWMNGFMMFSRMHRREYIAWVIPKHAGMHTSQVSRIMGHDWRQLSTQAKEKYRVKAQEYTKHYLKAADFNDI